MLRQTRYNFLSILDNLIGKEQTVKHDVKPKRKYPLQPQRNPNVASNRKAFAKPKPRHSRRAPIITSREFPMRRSPPPLNNVRQRSRERSHPQGRREFQKRGSFKNINEEFTCTDREGEFKSFTSDGTLIVTDAADNLVIPQEQQQQQQQPQTPPLDSDERVVESIFMRKLATTRHREDQKDDFCGSELLKSLGLLGAIDTSNGHRLVPRHHAGKCLGLPKRIRNLIHLMDKHGYIIGIETINTALFILKKKDLVRQAPYMMEWATTVFGVKPDIKSHNILLTAAARLGEDDLKVAWNNLLSSGLTPTTATYNTLLSLTPYYHIENTLLYIQKLSEGKFKLHLTAYNSIIQKATTFEDMMRWYQKIIDEGLKPDETTACCLMKSCALRGDTKGAEQIHEMITKTHKLKLTRWYWGSFLKCYVETGDYDGFCDTWKRMSTASPSEITVHTYLLKARALSKCLRAPGDFYSTEILRFATEIGILDHLSNNHILEQLFAGLHRVGDVQTAHKLADHLKTQCPAFRPSKRLSEVYENATKEQYKVPRNKERFKLWETRDSSWASRKMRK
eukprot:TRINITY_DN3223_c0_g1_i1.p1 TRINITY_DN3223_c0_g1~~TRINITY_DN3223_c0_g1_i1.p1  ORF type:complete len:565 (+),score=60.59 TRINITY_DN3223_c0_g1_i1:73-1767(+)